MSWLKSRLASAVKPLSKEWKRLRKDALSTLKEVKDACERIREEGEKCLADKDHRKHRPGRAALRFHKMIAGVLDSVDVPKELSTENIIALQKALARVYNAIGREWSGLLSKMEPYMIRARRKLKGAWRRVGEIVRELDDLLARCRPLELEDEVASQVAKVERLFSNLKSVEAEFNATSMRRGEARKKLEELLKAKKALESSEALKELREAEEAVRALSIEVRSEFRHAWKPLVKLKTSAEAGPMSLSSGEADTLRAYLSDPLAALAREEEGYPALRSLLTKLREALERGSITLKASKAEKLRKWLNGALSGSLSGLQEKCKRAFGELEALRSSEAVRKRLKELEALEKRISEVKREIELLEGRENSLANKRESLQRKLEGELKALEELLADITGEEVKVILG